MIVEANQNLIPEKPMNAMARMPAHMRAMGTPFMARGSGINSNCSRMPANIHRASVNPKEVEMP